jgi:hypothetical protein
MPLNRFLSPALALSTAVLLTSACEKAEHEVERTRLRPLADQQKGDVPPTVQRTIPDPWKAPDDAAVDSKHATRVSKAVQSITQALCARADTCGRIGRPHQHGSVARCEKAVSLEWREELNQYECPGGVVEDELDECIAELLDEDCTSPVDTLASFIACRASDICNEQH